MTLRAGILAALATVCVAYLGLVVSALGMEFGYDLACRLDRCDDRRGVGLGLSLHTWLFVAGVTLVVALLAAALSRRSRWVFAVYNLVTAALFAMMFWTQDNDTQFLLVSGSLLLVGNAMIWCEVKLVSMVRGSREET